MGCGVNPRYGAIDPYLMAWACVDEAVRNVVTVGADPDEISLLDNFCWGNPRLPDRMGGLLRCAQGCGDAAMAFKAPYVSGKDSLNNEFTGADGKKHSIPGTILITALGIVPDVSLAPQSSIYHSDATVIMVGETHGELGGSALVHALAVYDHEAPKPNPRALNIAQRVHRVIQTGYVEACHDCSEGGLAVALAEMVMDSPVGMDIDLGLIPTSCSMSTARLLFAESASRYLIVIANEHVDETLDLLEGVPSSVIGQTNSSKTLRLLSNAEVVEAWSTESLFNAHHSNPDFLP